MGIQKEVGSWMAAGESHEGACRQGSVVAAGRAVLCFSVFLVGQSWCQASYHGTGNVRDS